MEKTDLRNMKKHWDTRGRTGAVTKNGYRIFCRGDREHAKKQYEHRIIWEKYYGKIPEGYIVHHIDGNKLNNNIENLQLMTETEHAKRHALQRGLGKDRVGIAPINKTPQETIKQIQDLRSSGMFLKDIVLITGISYPTVQKYATQGSL